MKIKKIPFDINSQIIKRYRSSLNGIVDDFVEDLVMNAEHYLLYDQEELVGQIGVIKESVTFFYVLDDFKYKQREYFLQFYKAKKLAYAYASTADLDFFHTAVEYQSDIKMQAKFFLKTNKMPSAFDFDVIDFARLHDKEEIDLLTDSEFDDLHERIQKGMVYALKEEGELIGVGFISDSQMFKDQQTLGVFTKEEHQRRGVASSLIEFMAEKIVKERKKVVAGCYYYNEASSKMLTYSGFRLMNILCKIKLK